MQCENRIFCIYYINNFRDFFGTDWCNGDYSKIVTRSPRVKSNAVKLEGFGSFHETCKPIVPYTFW